METVAQYLKQTQAKAVERLVQRARAELPDYGRRDLAELTAAADRGYTTWCRAIAANDHTIAIANSERAIKETTAQHIDPMQVARTPWLIYETAMSMLNEAQGVVAVTDYLAFQRQAHRLTTLIATVGHARIANCICESAAAAFSHSAIKTV